MKALRPHQEQAIAMLRNSLAGGRRRPMLQAPTGFGKTLLAAAIVDGALRKGKRVLFTVPALSLVDQTVDAFWAEGIRDVGVIQAQHEMTNASRPVQVASVQTLMRREVPQADVVMLDECFAAGTRVETPKGPVAIETVRPGDEVFNATGVGRVEAAVAQLKETIEVVLSNGTSVRCTSDHPFFTEDGWQAAGFLEVGTRLFDCSDVQRLWCSDASVGGEKWEGAGGSRLPLAQVLHRVLREEAREPDAGSGSTRSHGGDAQGSWAQAESAGRQRGADAGAGTDAAYGARSGVEGGVGATHGVCTGADEIFDCLQNRLGSRRDEDSYRGGRDEPQGRSSAGKGSAEGRVLGSIRVVAVSRIERGCPEAVYNLRVGGHPSYFAGGVLVHNCHRWFEFYATWMGHADWLKVPFIGLSATPWTKGLGRYFDELIIAATTQELIDGGYLAPFRVFAPSHPDLSGVRTLAGDYHEADLAEAMNLPPLTADVVETWRKLGEDRPTFVFAVDRAHAKALQGQFLEAGISAEYIDAFTDVDEREVIRKRFHSGEVRVVCNVGCLVVGVDWDVRCISFCRPTKSEMFLVQAIGRGLRTAPGKKDLLILDHSDSHLRLGLVTDIHHDKLDDGSPKAAATPQQEREREAKLPQECPKCSFLKSARTAICPACGFRSEKKTHIECAEGELLELTRTQRKHNQADDWPAKIAFMRQLRAFAIERGRSPGWVAHAYKDRYGVWPNDPRVKDATAAAGVDPETRSWIKAKDIRFAKGREKSGAAA